MLGRIHFLHEILLNLLISCRKNKVSYHVFLLLLLVHEVYIENQEPRIEKSDWLIQISYALTWYKLDVVSLEKQRLKVEDMIMSLLMRPLPSSFAQFVLKF